MMRAKRNLPIPSTAILVIFLLSALLCAAGSSFSQQKTVSALPEYSTANDLLNNNIIWTSQSKNAGESMPLGGGDVGVNVWVEKGQVYLYIAQSGAFDENNSLLKAGRIKLNLSPNPFAGKSFKQELKLKDGYVQLSGADGKLNASVKIWVEVFRPIVHIEVQASKKVITEASYESWRYEDRITKGKENNQNSYKWAPQGIVMTAKDQVDFIGGYKIEFSHHNQPRTVFDVAVEQQGLGAYKAELYNPLKNLKFGGSIRGENMAPAGNYTGKYLSTAFKGWTLKSKKAAQTEHIIIQLYNSGNNRPVTKDSHTAAFSKNIKWWNNFWDRSFIYIYSLDSAVNQVSRNYQLFRYMLGCNAYGTWPTKFNGGLFTVDPELTDSTLKFTPDFRNWGGGTHTAQNQRLVYWPMLKSGDFEMMKPQFDFYKRLLKNAELRTAAAWQHKGASFTEQFENFGLPNPAEYGWKRPAGYNQGMEYNAWLEYEWDTVLEFCMMILETERYQGQDIQTYLPFIESCLTFFKEHYGYLARQRGAKTLDAEGHLILYPGSAAETYKMTYNSSSTIAALKTVLSRLLELKTTSPEQQKNWQELLQTIPPISYRSFNGKPTISPAKLWERINNVESPQLYPIFPWGIYGLLKPGLDTARNTYLYDTDVLKFRSHIGWKQDNIFAARLGLTDDAARLTTLKLKDADRRFPAFWGPGYDWAPDHNWGGSGMIGLQEMLMQCDGRKILLFPAWPKDWDVHFKLHAPYQTTVEGILEKGKLTQIKVIPESRRADIINMLL